MDILHKRIFELVGEQHGSIKSLADAIGVSGNLISNWKAGVSKSYTKYAPQIADYFGVSLDWLSGLSDDREIKKAPSKDEATNKKRAAAKARLDKLSEESIDKLMSMMDLMEL